MPLSGAAMSDSQKALSSGLKEITRLEDEIRDFINAGRNQTELLPKRSTWNQICSSLDVIGDTTLSISDYTSANFPATPGLQYIYTYGLLQALFLQQDAIRHLSEAFELNYTLSERLLKIRELRNSAIGHPTKQNVGKRRYYNYISRITMSKGGFTLMRSSGDDEETHFVNVDLVATVAEQVNEVQAALSLLSSKLKEADRMHKDQFNSSPLSEIFPPSTGYLFEKVSQGIHSPSYGNSSFGLSMLGLIEGMYLKFESALIERREYNDYIQYDLAEYKRGIQALKLYFVDNPKQLEEGDALIYHFYLRERHKHFEQIAREIDEEYGEA